MGHLKSPREIGSDLQHLPLQKPADDKFVWTYTSPEFPMMQVTIYLSSSNENLFLFVCFLDLGAGLQSLHKHFVLEHTKLVLVFVILLCYP